MLIENIFAMSLGLFMLMIIMLWTPKSCRHPISYFLFFGSLCIMIITAIMWIWRAWS